jgi:hypothetical protein
VRFATPVPGRPPPLSDNQRMVRHSRSAFVKPRHVGFMSTKFGDLHLQLCTTCNAAVHPAKIQVLQITALRGLSSCSSLVLFESRAKAC